jgi:hypothetical protein
MFRSYDHLQVEIYTWEINMYIYVFPPENGRTKLMPTFEDRGCHEVSVTYISTKTVSKAVKLFFTVIILNDCERSSVM